MKTLTFNGKQAKTLEIKKNIYGHTPLISVNGSENDCVVGAFAFLFFKNDYEKAEAYVSQNMDRKEKDGVSTFLLVGHLSLGQIGPKKVERLGVDGDIHSLSQNVNSRTKKPCKMTVGAFLKQFPKGSYFLIVKGHCFAVKDGEIFGNSDDAKKVKTPLTHAFSVKWK